MNIRQQALEFATRAHFGQKRRDGKDYITHPVAVAAIAEKLADEWVLSKDFYDDLYLIALFHDIYEDQPQFMQELRTTFGDHIADSVIKLSRRKKETYFSFISRIGDSIDMPVIFVKLADLEHNMSDLEEGSLKDKYRFAHYYLKQLIEEY